MSTSPPPQPEATRPLGGAGGREVDDDAYLVSLVSLAGMGPARIRRMLERWAPEQAWRAVEGGNIGELRATTNAGERVVQRWVRGARETDPEALLRRHREAGISVRRRGSPGYPDRLTHDLEPPEVLFAQGDLAALDHPTVTIVGTRRCTRYGADVAFDLGKAAAAHGAAVISGLALGIDAAAHAGALAAGETPPVGVVGSGLDCIYPRGNAVLWKMVAQRGVLLSEASLGTTPERWRFPARNRIMAGLADVIVIVESHADGGAMTTATEGARRGTTVVAVPGPVRSGASAGTNRLIAEGCGVLCDVEDLLVILDIERTSRPRPHPVADPNDAAVPDPNDAAAPDPDSTDAPAGAFTPSGRRSGATGADGAAESIAPGVDSVSLGGISAAGADGESEPDATGGAALAPGGWSAAAGADGTGGVEEDLPGVEAEGRAVLEALGWTAVTLETLAERTGLGLGELSWQLEQLTAAGHVARSGLWYERRSSGSPNA